MRRAGSPQSTELRAHGAVCPRRRAAPTYLRSTMRRPTCHDAQASLLAHEGEDSESGGRRDWEQRAGAAAQREARVGAQARGQ